MPANALDQLIVIAARQIGPPDRTGEEGVAPEDEVAHVRKLTWPGECPGVCLTSIRSPRRWRVSPPR